MRTILSGHTDTHLYIGTHTHTRTHTHAHTHTHTCTHTHTHTCMSQCVHVVPVVPAPSSNLDLLLHLVLDPRRHRLVALKMAKDSLACIHPAISEYAKA